MLSTTLAEVDDLLPTEANRGSLGSARDDKERVAAGLEPHTNRDEREALAKVARSLFSR
jgi:hypothetical protein